MVLALLLGAGFVGSCGDDKDETPEPQQPGTEQQDDQSSLPQSWMTGGYILVRGWTSATHVPPQGGQQFFKDYYAPGDSSTVTLKFDEKVEDGPATLIYSSSAWGVATFDSIAYKTEKTEDGERIILPDSLQSTIVMSRGAMGQQGGGGVYPITLLNSNFDPKTGEVQIVMSAFMNERHGNYELTFHRGKAPEAAVE